MYSSKFGSLFLSALFWALPMSAYGAPVSHVAATKNVTVHTALRTTKKHLKKSSGSQYRYKTYFVPPPPAYMPSILPELNRRGVVQAADVELEKKPENPYKKYVQTPDGAAPEPVQVRKGVVTWTSRS
jgi:hypothetical protein